MGQRWIRASVPLKRTPSVPFKINFLNGGHLTEIGEEMDLHQESNAFLPVCCHDMCGVLCFWDKEKGVYLDLDETVVWC